MNRLLEAFAPFFSYGLELDRRISAGTANEAASAEQERARQLLDAARDQALAAGKRPEQIQSALFAATAWFDEIVTRNPNWWHAVTALQVSLFNTNNAGNEFFDHLALLGSDDDEVREIYYHALLLGFVGQYYYENGDTGELGRLKDLHARQLPLAPAVLHTLRETPITPQPYADKDPSGPRYPRQWDRMLLRGGAIAALLIPLTYLAWIFLSAPQDTGPTLAERVQQQIQHYPCSDLSAALTPDGTATITGYVSRAEDIAQVHRDIAATEGITARNVDVKVRIWPHCEVVSLLKAYRERNREVRHGLAITPTTGHSDRFEEGERVTVKLRQPDFDGYLYVDYYTVDGTVIHLYPNRREPDSGRRILAGEDFNVGERIAEGWLVGPPFGQELITVMAAPSTLYDSERPEFEPASTYLPRLRELLEAQRANDKLVADYLFLQTEPKSPSSP